MQHPAIAQTKAPATPTFEPYLSHLRAALTFLVICHHTAIGLGGAGDWYFVIPPPPDSPAFMALTLFTAVNQSFFMALFFFIAGYLTPSSLERKGTARYLMDRFIRLGIPLLVYYFLLSPCAVYQAYRCTPPEMLSERLVRRVDLSPATRAFFESVICRFSRSHAGSLWAFFQETWPAYCGPGPLWFTETLLIFTCAYILWRVIHPWKPVLPLPGTRDILFFIFAMGLMAFVIRLVFPVGAFLPVLGIQPAHFPLYIALFIVGTMARPSGWLNQLQPAFTRRWFLAACGTVCLMPVILAAGSSGPGGVNAFLGGLSWQAAVYSLMEPVLCVGICLQLLVAFRDYFNQPSLPGRLLSENAYAAYIIHPFFVIAATCMSRSWGWDPLVKFLPLCLLAAIPAFTAAALLRRMPLLHRVL